MSILLKSYNNQNIYLAETASALSRLLHYEVPALKKQISSLEQEEADLVRREVNLQKTYENAKISWEETCKEYNVDLSDSNNIEKDAKTQLLRSSYKLQDQASKIMAVITTNANEILNLVEAYRKISGFLNEDESKLLENLEGCAKNEISLEWDENVEKAINGVDSGMISVEEDVDWDKYIESADAVPNGGSGSSYDMVTDAIQYRNLKN